MNKIRFVLGEKIKSGGKLYLFERVLDLERILCKDIENGQLCSLSVKDLLPVLEVNSNKELTEHEQDTELALLNAGLWEEAQRRFDIIRPLLESPYRTAEVVKEQAEKAGVHFITLYRWIKAYESTGRVSSLIKFQRTGGKNKSRLQLEIETIIQTTIEDFYLTKQRRSIQKVCIEVMSRCRNAKLAPPHPNTVRNRIAQISDRVKMKRRVSSKMADEIFSPKVGKFPGADWPLSVIQIDHTPMDIILVDDTYRLPIARPWITLAIDTYSRMVAGFYISFDRPSALSVGLCAVHAILPKEKWLAKFGIKTSWPLWGIMRKIYVDNAKEFRGDMLKRACQEYGIDLEWRPLRKPEYGAHIERLLGTFLQEVHSLSGTTFSNIQKKGEYNSEAKAVMTLREFEEWLANYITGVYHQRIHSSLKTSPLKQYEKGVFGTEDMPGSGLPSLIVDEDKLRLDFMPYVERTIQPYGIVIEGIHYYSEILRKHINSRMSDRSKKKRLFIFKRDPRDISVVYFFDPELKQYSIIPYRNTSRPPISVWELRKITKHLEEQGKRDIDEDLIFETYERMKVIEEKAIRQSKAVRLAKEKRLLNQQVAKPKSKKIKESLSNKDANQLIETESQNILPFSEMEELDYE